MTIYVKGVPVMIPSCSCSSGSGGSGNQWWSPKQTSDTSPLQITAQTQYSPNEAGWKAFDGDENTFWSAGLPGGAIRYLQIVFSTFPPAIYGFRMLPVTVRYNDGCFPSKIEFQGSNDQIDWETIKIFDGIEAARNEAGNAYLPEWVEFRLNSSVSYMAYRMVCTPEKNVALDIAEVEFLIGSGGSCGEDSVYSTEETRIGTWIDGKPIYRKVTTTQANGRGRLLRIEDLEIDHLIDLNAIAIPIGSSYVYSGVSYYESSASRYALCFKNEPGNREITFDGGTVFQDAEFTLILEYTKTTD